MERRLTALLSHLGGGGEDRGMGRYVLVTDCTPHACSFLSHSSFSYLRPAIKYKKARREPYNYGLDLLLSKLSIAQSSEKFHERHRWHVQNVMQHD
jgi:hypothetical protein